ncbi:type VII secretion protein EccE [Mycolicibacterium sp. GF69]|mgnify:FL=1|jgi:type VII secretion protein EccE|uniref:ESX-5 secretion system protein EccE5 n=3 Tax=Mycolicibacterium TaxID=1866885 RepID=A0A5S9PA08_MYCVN|nr:MULTISPECIES: type VII secretion protein EccE [Mycolicibacterium]ORB61829.1 type VII secretion protein EccE [Mycolicibacterium tusciae]RAV07931.1 type VII secretion protein EccE [Mycolicibacterium sp. GF69]CAA0100522.1 ESX-5 secretion system protein EccE5 [Mycolicibacterium vanbaalenii]
MVMLDEHIPGPKAGLSEQIRRWRLDFRLALVVTAEIIALAVLAAITPVLWWVAVLIAVAALLVVTLSYNGATAWEWLVRALRYAYFRRNTRAHLRRAGISPAFTVDMPGAGAVGMRWDGQYAITMIALHGKPFAPTVLVPAGAETTSLVPVQAVIDQLHQFAGLELHSADIVSAGARVALDGRYTPKYEEIIADRAAVGERRTWLVLRLCPQACLAAMMYRGDAAAAAAAATERVRQSVLRAGCRAITCTADQVDQSTKALLAGAELERIREGWGYLDTVSQYVTTYRIAGNDLTTRVLNDVWTVRSDATVTSIRLTADRAGVVAAGAVVRFHTAAPLPHPPLLTLRPIIGQCFDSLLASLPLGDRALRLEMSPRRLTNPAELKVPVGPSGPMLGMTVTGVPFLMPLTDPLRASTISVSASLDAVIPLLLRASAAGSVILIHTERPQVWQPLLDNAHRISLASDREPVRPPNVIVADGIGHGLTAGERGHTLITLTDVAEPSADVTLVQQSGDELVLGTPSVQGVRLSIMRPRNEAQFLSHLVVRT